MALPEEMLLEIVELVAVPSASDDYFIDYVAIPDDFCANLNSIAISCKRLYNVANPILYRRAVRPAYMVITLLQHPNLAALVREVYIHEDKVWKPFGALGSTIEWRRKRCPESSSAVSLANNALAAYSSFYLAPQTRASDVFYWLSSLCLALCCNVRRLRIRSSDLYNFDLPPRTTNTWELSTLEAIEFTLVTYNSARFNEKTPRFGPVFSNMPSLKRIYIGSTVDYRLHLHLSESVTDIALSDCTILPEAVRGLFERLPNLERLYISFLFLFELAEWDTDQKHRKIVAADYFRNASSARKLRFLQVQFMDLDHCADDPLSFKEFPALEAVALDTIGHSLYPRGSAHDYGQFFPPTIRIIHLSTHTTQHWDISPLAHAKSELPKLATVSLSCAVLTRNEVASIKSVFDSVGVSFIPRIEV